LEYVALMGQRAPQRKPRFGVIRIIGKRAKFLQQRWNVSGWAVSVAEDSPLLAIEAQHAEELSIAA